MVMPEKQYRRATSAALRNLLDLMSAEDRETTTVAAFLRQFEEHGHEISDSGRLMVERILDRDGETLDYDAVFAAADDLVACCNGSLELAMDALKAYRAASGRQIGVEGPFAAS
jgi:hypothetical protein